MEFHNDADCARNTCDICTSTQVYDQCGRCLSFPGQLVRLLPDCHVEPLCTTCWGAVRSVTTGGDGTAKVLGWINYYGRLSGSKGANSSSNKRLVP